jgi:CheY-like chemotaxis protein
MKEDNDYEDQIIIKKRKEKKILLVDDEPDVCMVYHMVLEDVGFNCTSYANSVKALQEFKPAYYDLILLDIKMPVLNGFELCKKIRAIDKKVQMIFITASEQFYENIREKSSPKINDINNIKYIQKPISNEELVDVVNRTLATRDMK